MLFPCRGDMAEVIVSLVFWVLVGLAVWWAFRGEPTGPRRWHRDPWLPYEDCIRLESGHEIKRRLDWHKSFEVLEEKTSRGERYWWHRDSCGGPR